MKHLMIDLETLDTRPSSVIVSVGAVLFDKEGIHKKGYWVLDQDDQIRRGRTVSASTISWWMQQSQEARNVFVLREPPVTVAEFGDKFKLFTNGEKVAIWGNGSDFDTAIMIDFWQRHNLPKVPGWSYSNHMCFRTYNKLFDCKKLKQREGVHHNALDDAIYQTECVLAAVRNGNPLT